jgi:hypothetical protein
VGPADSLLAYAEILFKPNRQFIKNRTQMAMTKVNLAMTALRILTALVFAVFVNGTVANEDVMPEWWESRVGTEDILLPGFQPLAVERTSVHLGMERTYDWRGGLLPLEVSSLGAPMARNFHVRASFGAQEEIATASTVGVVSSSTTRATVEASGKLGPIDVETVSEVEYDGLISVALTLLSQKDVEGISTMALQFQVAEKAPVTVVGFDAQLLRTRNKDVTLKVPYGGAFKNAFGFSDGDRSIWWFSDSGEYFEGPGAKPVSIERKAGVLDVRIPITVGRLVAKKPVTIRFNLLVTPVKHVAGEWRGNWIARNVNKEEAECAKIQSWWITAFAHEDLPYLELPPGVGEALPKVDISAYPGMRTNNKILAESRALGIVRLPYFSAHSLSPIDPALSVYRKKWEVMPNFIMPPGSDEPFTAKLRKPWLSHNAPGYTNYLLSRFDSLANELSFGGLYFDQGGVIGSAIREHGAWSDSAGKIRPALDILATRAFFKRLAVLFYKKQRPGYVLVHNSGASILPAYTFVTAMVQGEEFEETLKGLDYIDSANIDQIRALYSPNQNGVVTVWLDEAWSPKVAGDREGRYRDQNHWMESKEYVRAWRKLMTLALLHDVPVWSFVPMEEKRKLCRAFAPYKTSNTRFTGYWTRTQAEPCGRECKVSLYVNSVEKRTMAIIGNLSAQPVSANLADMRGLPNGDVVARILGADGDSRWAAAPSHVSVPPKDFILVEIKSRK